MMRQRQCTSTSHNADEKCGVVLDEHEYLPGEGDLAHPTGDVVVWVRTGTLSLDPLDLGIVTYFNEINGNIEILCRGQVCQSSVENWRKS